MENKFKPGNKVRCMYAGYTANKFDEVLEVAAYYPANTQLEFVGRSGKTYQAKNFELLTNPGFKVGDKVRYIGPLINSDFVRGEVAAIDHITKSGNLVFNHKALNVSGYTPKTFELVNPGKQGLARPKSRSAIHQH